MIRKLKSGAYRLYSRKLDPETHKRRNLGTFGSRALSRRFGQAKENPPKRNAIQDLYM